MVENNGKVNLDFNEIKEAGFEQSAEIFSEDCESLKKTLVKLWENGFFTFACCKGKSEPGHRTDIIKQPYVSILIDEENKQEVFKFVKHLLASKSANKPNVTFFSSRLAGEHRFSVLLDRSFIKNSSCDKMFDSISESLDHYKSAENASSSSKAEEALKLCQDLGSVVPTLPYSEIILKVPHGSPEKVSLTKRDGMRQEHFKSKKLDDMSKDIDENSMSIEEAESCNIQATHIIKPKSIEKVSKEELNANGYEGASPYIPSKEQLEKEQKAKQQGLESSEPQLDGSIRQKSYD